MKRIIRNALLSSSLFVSSLPITAAEPPSCWQSCKNIAIFLVLPPDIVTNDKIYRGTSLWCRSITAQDFTLNEETQNKVQEGDPLSKKFTWQEYSGLCESGRTLAHYYHTMPTAPFLALLKYAALGYTLRELFVITTKELCHQLHLKIDDRFAFYERERYTAQCRKKNGK